MTLRNLLLWSLAGALFAWMAAVAFETRRCQARGGQFSILGWQCVSPKPAVILRRELERT
jgi:hypothetical protein